MKIFLSPQVSTKKIIYEFNEETVSAKISEEAEVFNFKNVPNGKLELIDPETGEETIKTTLEVNPILSAEKKGGILYLELLNWISEDAPESERFPEWIDAKDYKAPVEPEPEKEPEVKEADPVNKNAAPEDWGEF